MSDQAMDFIQNLRASRPTMPTGARRSQKVYGIDGQPLDHDIPSGPDHPEWRKRIPPAEDPPELEPQPKPTIVTPNGTAASVTIPREYPDPRKRLVINYARDESVYMISIETAPDWDIVERPRRVRAESLIEMLPFFGMLGVRVKDNTGEMPI